MDPRKEIAVACREKAELLVRFCNDPDVHATIAGIVDCILTTFNQGGKVLICGNGGSAADANHLAAEFIGRFRLERPGLPSISLCANTSLLTALANDYGFETVFARQVATLADERDALIVISTSGASQNTIKALEEAKKKGVATIGLSGKRAIANGFNSRCDHCLVVPSEDTATIQEGHLLAYHLVCNMVERLLFDREKTTTLRKGRQS